MFKRVGRLTIILLSINQLDMEVFLAIAQTIESYILLGVFETAESAEEEIRRFKSGDADPSEYGRYDRRDLVARSPELYVFEVEAWSVQD